MKYLFILSLFIASLASYGQQTDSAKASGHYTILLKLQPHYTDPANWTQQAINTVQRHFMYYQEMEKRGKLLFGGRTDYKENNPAMFGIIVFRAPSATEAEKVMQNDPAILAGIMTGTLHPFVVAFGNRQPEPQK